MWNNQTHDGYFDLTISLYFVYVRLIVFEVTLASLTKES